MLDAPAKSDPVSNRRIFGETEGLVTIGLRVDKMEDGRGSEALGPRSRGEECRFIRWNGQMAGSNGGDQLGGVLTVFERISVIRPCVYLVPSAEWILGLANRWR